MIIYLNYHLESLIKIHDIDINIKINIFLLLINNTAFILRKYNLVYNFLSDIIILASLNSNKLVCIYNNIYPIENEKRKRITQSKQH